jgi:hypothetical protein
MPNSFDPDSWSLHPQKPPSKPDHLLPRAIAIMVKFRGIEVSIVSQFDIRKLPEFRVPEKSREDPFTEQSSSIDSQAVASCFIPIYAGSQSKSPTQSP